MDWLPDFIALGASGTNSFYLLGALHEFKSSGVLEQVKGYSGSGTGALIATLLNVGYNPAEIMTFGADSQIFSDFFSVQLGEYMSELSENRAMLSNTHIKNHIEEAIFAKYGCIPSMKGLYTITGKKLYLTSYNLDLKRTIHFSYETHPELSCVTAILLSMNIPIIFYRIKYKEYTYIDGGMVEPVPVAAIDDSSNNVLAICTAENVQSEDFRSLTSNIHEIMRVSLSKLMDMIIQRASHKCRFLRFNCSSGEHSKLKISPFDKANMVLDGINGARSCISNMGELSEIPSKSIVVDWGELFL